MNYIAVDDEFLALETLRMAIEEADSGCTLKIFRASALALETIRNGYYPDVAFLDIELHDRTGLELAKEIRELSPKTRIVFVTGYSEYAISAFRVNARGYLLKPVTAEAIRRQLDVMKEDMPLKEKAALRIQCFGNFEVFYNNKPIHFYREKSKEILALLVDRRGSGLSTAEIAAVIFEGKEYDNSVKNQTGVMISSLKKALKELGAGDVLVKSWNSLAINTAAVDCDYYGFLDGDINCINRYVGEYMNDYPWAQFTNEAIAAKQRKG